MDVQTEQLIEAKNLSIGHGSHVIQRKLNFQVKRKSIITIMGASGAGKSHILHTMVGLREPLAGDVLYDNHPFWEASLDHRRMMAKRFGMMYQHGALWNSMTLAENVAMPLRQLTGLHKEKAVNIANYKLALVGLSDYAEYLPVEVSLGMRKRASIVRAMALEPDILFLDDPSAGIDPIHTRWFNELLVTVRDVFGTTIVIATNDLEIIYGIADYIIFLDAEKKTITAQGDLDTMLSLDENQLAYQYLTYGDTVRTYHKPQDQNKT